MAKASQDNREFQLSSAPLMPRQSLPLNIYIYIYIYSLVNLSLECWYSSDFLSQQEGPVSWKFSNVQIESEKRTLLEVYGYAEAALSRCTLTGSNVDGEVNRCTDAILIRSLQRSRPVPQLPDAHRSGPRVTVHSSALRHSDQALRILVPAGGLNSTAHLTNCLVENNTKGFVMACSSQVCSFLVHFRLKMRIRADKDGADRSS